MQKNISKMIQLLEKKYPSAKTELMFNTPFQLLVATILSAQTTDRTVNKITPALFERYKTPYDFVKADIEELKNAIRGANYYNTKAKNIKKLAEIIVERYSGQIPETTEELVKLPGVARKTANVVLSQGFGKAEGIVVDTHVKRLAERLGMSKAKTPEKIEQDLMKIIPREKWISFPFTLILHGRRVCKAKNPLCDICILNSLCPYGDKSKCQIS
ncbi:MAG: endonuclease III [Candidatus Omnitrophica bacterium]|nr:endonuclease III [Candidatus Omnitrophota bacterium]MCM8777403.1 endonuclease III [Candidatus Omnitrophota bacterium]